MANNCLRELEKAKKLQKLLTKFEKALKHVMHGCSPAQAQLKQYADWKTTVDKVAASVDAGITEEQRQRVFTDLVATGILDEVRTSQGLICR